jgi:hypothetical protein
MQTFTQSGPPPVLTTNWPEVIIRTQGRDLNPESFEHEARAVCTIFGV